MTDYACSQCGGTGRRPCEWCQSDIDQGEDVSCSELVWCPGPHVVVGDVCADPSKVVWRCWGAVSKGIKATLHIGGHNDKCGWYQIGERIEVADEAVKGNE